MSDRICDYLLLGSGITGMSTALFLASCAAEEPAVTETTAPETVIAETEPAEVPETEEAEPEPEVPAEEAAEEEGAVTEDMPMSVGTETETTQFEVALEEASDAE